MSFEPKDCAWCNGTGKTTNQETSIDNSETNTNEVSGYIVDEPCHMCKGKGYIYTHI